MTLAEMVEKYGEVRLTRIQGVKHDDKGVALITREIVNNQVVERNVAALVAWYERLLEQRAALAGMGRAALNSVQRYDAEVFRTRWAELIGELLAEN